jgi:hypothetical protein
MRSRCHHRPLNRHAKVADCWGCTSAVGRGHNASRAAAIAAASSSVGAGLIELADTFRPYRTRPERSRRRTPVDLPDASTVELVRLDRQERRAA